MSEPQKQPIVDASYIEGFAQLPSSYCVCKTRVNSLPKAAQNKNTQTLQPPFSVEQELLFLARLRNGETEIFETLWKVYEPALRRTAHRIVQNPSDLDDILQTTMLKAFNHLGTFRGEGSLRTWLTSIALNEARQHRRRCRSRREIAFGSSPELLVQSEAKKRYDMACRISATQDALTLLYAQISSLPQPYQAILRLRYIENSSLKETAHQLDLSLSATKSRLFRGLRLLRDVLKRKRVR